MNLKRVTILVLISINLCFGNSQYPGTPPGQWGQGSSITGKVHDAETKQGIEYANIMLYTTANDSAVTGTITDHEGRFFISQAVPGIYYLTAKFMGYEELRIDSVSVAVGIPFVNLGDLEIHPASLEGQSVAVERERTSIEYKIDKKVINVGQDITSSAGSAVEVLENVPSVSVDIDGNVSLRGSSSFTVLIDNRPSLLEGSDALRTIPASTIENIEIITNPSAAYDPDGVSGIINVITKKSSLEGISGLINMRVGQLGDYGGDVLVNHRNDRYSVFISAAYGEWIHEGRDSTWSETTFGDTTNHLNSLGDRNFGGKYYRLRSGLDYNFTDNDILGLQLSYGGHKFQFGGKNEYNRFVTISDSISPSIFSNTDGVSAHGGNFFDFEVNFEHRFSSAQHRIQSRLNYGLRDTKSESQAEEFGVSEQLITGTKTIAAGPVGQGRLELSYKQPLKNEGELEAGYHFRFGSSEDASSLEVWDSTSAAYHSDPHYDHNTSYARNIHATFITASTSLRNWGIQGGLRGEYTFREIKQAGGDESYKIDRPDIFPSLHLSYKVSELNKLQASYSRRIDRPRGWFLEPFETWMDAYNVRKGNPGLKPQYINSYEFGYLAYFGKGNTFSVDVYSRGTNNLLEPVQSVYAENILLHTFENVGTSKSVGSEVALRFSPFKWWNLNLMGNAYHYELNDIPQSVGDEVSSDNWSLRFNSDFNINKMVRLQLNTMYNSPSVTAQGERDAMFFVNAGARLNFLENKLSVSVNIQDLLDTGDFENVTEGPLFYRRTVSDRVAPVASISLRYNFNNYQPKRFDMNGMGGGEASQGDDF